MLFLILAAAVSVTDFAYDPQGRRDPFVSQQPRAQRGSLVQELKLTGIVRTPQGYRALVESVMGQSQVLTVGDRIHDETVVAIDADGVTFRKDDRTEFRLSVSR